MCVIQGILRRRTVIVGMFAVLAAAFATSDAAALERIEVRLDAAAASKPVTGRLFVLFTTAKSGEPRMGPS